MIAYEKVLNEQQLAAVKADPGPMLVIAGAGSGKTQTLTYRVAYLIENGLPPDRLLLLTFTNKAAKEMLQRVGTIMPLDVGKIWGGTFHSISNRILRRHAKMIGFESNYAILDREDSKDLIQACIPEAGINVKEKRFPKADVLIEIFSLGVNKEKPISEIVTQQFNYFEGMNDQMMAVKRLYTERKKKANAMDYDDLLSNLLLLFREHADLAEVYGRQFLSILVDEYQDTNRIQSDIVDKFAARHQNVMVVGDDAQSIYSWRGANFRNIMDFPKRYPKARIFKIEQNYRSTPQILGFANQAIAANINQFTKNLQPTRKDGLKPQVVPVVNANEQATFIAQQMLELREQGLSLNDMAVLYRSHYHSMELQMELTRRNIPFQITSGLRFFEQSHVKDVCSYLKIAINPSDELSFKRIVLMMPKIGPSTAAKLWHQIQPNLLDYSLVEKGVPKLAQKEWKQLNETLKQLREPHVLDNPAELIRIAIEAGYEEYLKSKFENYSSRREDLEQLANYASRFNKTDDFLADLALMTNVDTEQGKPDTHDDEFVRLSTVHQAKGQEFGVVFVVWLTDGCFPNYKALETPEGEEEERRLFYVAVTRAKDELYLLHPQLKMTGGYGDTFQKPSRFLQEISKKFYDKREVDVGLYEN
jgi:DNA helicase II / ATP-dependent DNA helicase PcrA